MKHILLSLAALVILLSSCKKELQPTPTLNAVEAQSLTYDPPPPPGTCEGNEWVFNGRFYGDFYFHSEVADMDPIVYNDKVYVPEYDSQQVHIFNGSTTQHISSNIPLITDYRCFSLTIGNKGYVGNPISPAPNKFYQYNFSTNTWLRKADCPFERRQRAAAFTIGTKGYVACGMLDYAQVWYKDLWEYNSVANTWTRKADMPVALAHTGYFVLNDKAYVVGGMKDDYSHSNAVYEYDPANNSWSTKAPLPGGGRYNCIAFVINGKAYCGGGNGEDGPKRDYYRYVPSTNSWSRVADMSLDYLTKTEYGFSINSAGYAVYHNSYSDYLYAVKYTPLVCTLP